MARKLKFSPDSPDIIHLSDCFQRLTLEDHSVDNDVEMTSPGREAFPNPPYGTLVKCLIRSDAKEFVLRSYEDIYLAWTTLQQSTSFPSNIPCTDTRVASALSYLDAMITDRGNSHLLKRLAYVQLTRTVAALYELISNDRNVRAWPRKRQVHSDVAVDIYLRAQTRKCQRNEILRRMSLGKRWSDLAGPSPLLVVTYSDEAERVVSDPRISNPQLQAAAAEILLAYPAVIIQSSAYMFQQSKTEAKGSLSQGPSGVLQYAKDILRNGE